MTLATLKEVLQPAQSGGYAVAGLVTLGWEDMRAYVEAAEQENLPVILQAGPSCRAHTPLPILGKMFRHLAEEASVPVVAHLDHGHTFEECREALESGFTSLMFDGSRKPLAQNIDETAAIVELARSAQISCEGEIGFVGYSGGENSAGTDPDEAAKFARETGVDAMLFRLAMCTFNKIRKAGLMNRDCAQSRRLQMCPWSSMGALACPPHNVAIWPKHRESANLISALNCVWPLARRCALRFRLILIVLTGWLF